MRNAYRGLIVALFLIALPAVALAQGSIAGAVRDASGANPATNPWMTPQAIMDGRYVRFGMQLNF